ncbi:hypothetical protein PTTG_27011 [Puccinia triticina 1-1 BBBD Race 1]|uniref:Uncharacterized protein n=2 Tax=Puccinia triticina TaxID=208348 RepID=A0A180GPS0_PUCT1|nr:uncharacterized protein PtA15_13A212 [Puccinia triticina]OAV94389.1 hypothetical protein PTTG_27011 [Puccinia triticina 1-1 BBBD Race 1]WAQ90813.1 hypothetical protein PtA15_13A212 [Puccinia triticina]WAR60999.1 hypothetical protein PtB15_13B250 [Puccinia triticina]
MAESHAGRMSGLINSFEGLQSEAQQIPIYEDQVTKEMARIHEEYRQIWDRINYGRGPRALFNEIAIRTQLLAKLESICLPCLHGHVYALSKALVLRRSDPPIHNQPLPFVSKLKLMLKVLSKLESTLRDIKFAIACISPELDTEQMREDKDLKQLKLFPCSGLALRTYATTGLVTELLRISCEFIKESGHNFFEDPSKRNEIESMSAACLESVNQTLIFISHSEANIFQGGWEVNIKKMSGSLEKFVKFVNRTQAEIDEENRLSLADQVSTGPETSRPVRNTSQPPQEAENPRLAHATISVISIIKLSRLLVAKLLKMSTDKENLAIVSDLSSRELALFVTMVDALTDSIEKLVDALCADIPEDQYDDIIVINTSICHLLTAPRFILQAVRHIFRPVHHDQPLEKIHLKAWFYRWNKLHHSTATNLDKIFGLNLPL